MACGFQWKDGDLHICGEPYGHATPHQCLACKQTRTTLSEAETKGVAQK